MPVDVKRALKDKAYLDSLTDAERKELLEKAKELGDADLERIAGGMRKETQSACSDARSCTISC
jgi:dihydrodipicolinate synthase/N-acetylneuraminate lyase